MNIVVGEAFYNESLTGKTTLKIAFALQKDVVEDKNSVTDDAIGVRSGTGPSWNYIELAEKEFTFTLPTSYPTNGKIYDINDTSHNSNEKYFLSLGVLILVEKLLVNSTKIMNLKRAHVNTIKKLCKSFKQ